MENNLSREEIFANKVTPIFIEALKEYAGSDPELVIQSGWNKEEIDKLMDEFFTEEKVREYTIELIKEFELDYE